MDEVKFGLIIIQAIIASLMRLWLWLSARTKTPFTSKPQLKALRESSAHQGDTRQPLEILYPDSANAHTGRETKVDIIAVHGLGSNVDWSWTWKDGEKCVNWLRDSDMLPAKVPHSRIIAYNYESKWHTDAPKTRLQLCGEELIHSIHSFWNEKSGNPIILVGHSLGGNVIANALLYANSEEKFAYLLEATVGLVFLGTPFRGTKWQPFLESVVSLTTLAGSHNGITRELDFDEPVLLDKLHSFCRLLNRRSIPASCFSELYETDYGRRFGVEGAIKGMIVNEASACIPGIERHALQTDHLKINKYSSPTDRSFLMVSASISEMCINAKDIIRRRQDPREIITDRRHVLRQNPQAEACLRDLFLTDPQEDRIALKRKKGDRARGTCEWMLGTEEITTWLGSAQEACEESPVSNILWLHGNPGTGKSTMAIFLTEELPKIFSTTDGKSLAYFFCDSSFDKRKSAISIIRGLLLQFIQQHPRLLEYLIPKYKERGADLFKSFEALWEILIAVAADNNTGQKYCIIDALDECDHASQDTLLRQIHETFNLYGNTSIHILITSRPFPEIYEYLGEFANKDLASFSNAKQDIEICIEDNLSKLAQRKHYTSKFREQIRDILKRKAEGTFLWVGLACRELEDVPSKDAVKLLDSMPKGLHSLYANLLKTALAQNTEAEIIRRILGFVVVALRPLGVAELSEFCQLHDDEVDMETRIQFTREHIASCRLMVTIQDDKVLLLHQSVRDYLAGAGSGYFINELEAHADVAYRCVDLLIHQSSGMKQQIGKLLNYATQDWANHARMAKSRFEVRESQAEFFTMESPSRERWLKVIKSNAHDLPRRCSILHVAAHWGISLLVVYIANQNHEQRAIEEMMSQDANMANTPIDLAIYRGYTTVIFELLRFGVRLDKYVTTIAAENENTGKELVQLFLNQRGDEIKISEEVIKSAVQNYGCGDEIIKLLLDQRGDEIFITAEIIMEATDNEKKKNEIMTMLLDRRGDTVTLTEPIISFIAKGCNQKVIELLFDRLGGQITITEEVLQAAASNEDSGEEVITFLLDRQGDDTTINVEIILAATRNNSSGDKILALLFDRYGDEITVNEEIVLAAIRNESCNEDLMRLLLNQREDEIAINEEIILAAARSSRCSHEIMTLLLDRKERDINITEGVIKAAALGSNCSTVELLLGRLEGGEAARMRDRVDLSALYDYGAQLAQLERQNKRRLKVRGWRRTWLSYE